MTTANETPNAHVWRTASERVDLFGRPQGERVFASLRGVIDQTSQEYAGRALIELIQNGHDAMTPAGRPGRIDVVFDADEGDHGVLYVANTGRPFNSQNFDAICDIARSDKHIDEGIGNKGVGFKSILSLTNSPEVYSARSGARMGAPFDGYCFRFAREADLLVLAEGDPALARRLRAVSPLSLPVPVPPEGQVERVKALARAGFATVVRLPLRDAVARSLLIAQLDELAGDDPPILLFLDRIEVIAVDSGAPETSCEIRRTVRNIRTAGDGAEVATVEVGGDRRFLVARRRPNVHHLRAAIKESVNNGLLDQRWLEWRGETWVGIAVLLGGDPTVGRFYTFLPMGSDASAPVPAHVNGPFFTRLARIDLNPDIPLNALILDEVATLALLVASELVGTADPAERAACVDLISWEPSEADRLKKAAGTLGLDLASARLIPTMNEAGWDNLTDSVTWSTGFETISRAQLAGQHKAPIIDPNLGSARIDALANTAYALLERAFDPSPALIATWVELTAKRLLREQVEPAMWGSFYDDLARLPHQVRGELQGLAILIDDGGRLQRVPDTTVNRPEKLLFFSPVADTDADLDEPSDQEVGEVPRQLKRYLGFMNRVIEWAPIGGGRRHVRPGRRFLEEAGFVHEYRADRVLRAVGRATAGKATAPTLEAALCFTFDLWRSNRAPTGLNLRLARLKVPVRSGCWADAASSHFSGGWTEPGRWVEQLASAEGEACPELHTIAESLLVSPDAWPAIAGADTATWRRFLLQAGVHDGLSVMRIELDRVEFHGSALVGQVGAELQLDKRTARAWQDRSRDIPWMQTNYRVDEAPALVPGQRHFDGFSDESKAVYGRLIAKGLSDWPDDAFRCSVSKPHGNQHRPPLESPLNAFLRTAPWVPVVEPRHRSRRFETPDGAWHVRSAHAPRYPPLVAPEVRGALETTPQASRRTASIGLNIWDDPRSRSKLTNHLVELLASGAVGPRDRLALRNDYTEAWTDVVKQRLDNPLDLADEARVLVDRGNQLEIMPVDEDTGASTLVVPDTKDHHLRAMLSSIRRPILAVAEQVGEKLATAYLHPWTGDRVRLLSEIEVDVLLDGRSAKAMVQGPMLSAGQGWAADFVGVLLLLSGSHFQPVSPDAAQIAVDRVRRAQLARGAGLSVVVDGQRAELPEHLRHTAAVVGGDAPLVALTSAVPWPGWTGLIEVAPALCSAIGHPGATQALELAARKMRDIQGAAFGAPEPDQLAEAFHEPVDRIVEAQSALRGATERVFEQLAPVVGYYAGPSAVALLGEGEPSAAAVVERALTQLGSHVADPEAIVLAAQGATSLEDLVDRLSLDLRRLNAVLAELGEPFEPIVNHAGHQAAFEAHVARVRVLIIDLLRATYRPEGPCQPVDRRYLDARDLSSLTRDPEWVHDSLRPSEARMQRRVDEWLFAQGVERTRLPAESNLPPLADIQHENRRTIKDVLRRLASIEGISVRGGDGGPLTPEEREEFADQAYAEGITDFDRIDPTNILAWLRRSGRIDGNLPLSGEDLEVAAMGSGPAPTPPPDVPTLTVNGKALPASAADYDQLAEAVQAALSDDFLNSGATYLEVPTVTSGRTRHESGAKQRRGQGGRHRDASDATAWATGYIGEVAANAWLVRRFGTERVRWCSSYRDDHQGGKEGDNSLGYDFEVIDGDRRLYYEVKATKGTETTFELRPVEHRFATDHAGDDSFRILFLTEVLDGTRCRAYELPNPLGREAHRFTLLDSSMRLAFTVHDCDD